MVKILYAGGKNTQYSAPLISQVSGGDTTALSEGVYRAVFRFKNKVGFSQDSLPSNPITLSAGKKLKVTIPFSVMSSGDSWDSVIIALSKDNSPYYTACEVFLRDTTNYLNRDYLFSLFPVEVYFSSDLDLNLNKQLDYLSDLESINYSDYLNGSVIKILQTNEYYTIYKTPINKTVYTPYGRSNPYSLDQKWDKDIREFTSNVSISYYNPPYSANGSVGYPDYYFIYNDSPSYIPKGTRIGFTFFIGDQDYSVEFEYLYKVRLLGYVNLNNGVLDTKDESNVIDMFNLNQEKPCLYKKSDLVLPKNLPSGFACLLQVYPKYSYYQLSNTIPANFDITVTPFLFLHTAIATDLGHVLGDLIANELDRRVVVPHQGVNLKVLSGSGLIKGYSFRYCSEDILVGLLNNTDNQKVYIDVNGNCILSQSSTVIDNNIYSLRAIVSTKSGFSNRIILNNNFSAYTSSPEFSFRFIFPTQLSISFYSNISNYDIPFIGILRILVKNKTTNQIRYIDYSYNNDDNLAYIDDTFHWLSANTVSDYPSASETLDGLWDINNKVTNFVCTNSDNINNSETLYEISYCLYYDGNLISDIDHNPTSGCLPVISSTISELFLRYSIYGSPVGSLSALASIPQVDISDYQRRTVLTNPPSDYIWDPNSLESESIFSIKPNWLPLSSPGRWIKTNREVPKGFGFLYRITTSTLSAGYIKFNNTNILSATECQISFYTDTGNNLSYLLSSLVKPGSYILIYDYYEQNKFVTFYVNSINTGYSQVTYTISQISVSNGFTLSNNSYVYFSPNLKGDTGLTGDLGFGITYKYRNSGVNNTPNTYFNLDTVGNGSILSAQYIYMSFMDSFNISNDSIHLFIKPGTVIQANNPSNNSQRASFLVNSITASSASQVYTLSVVPLFSSYPNNRFQDQESVRFAFGIPGPPGMSGMNLSYGFLLNCSSSNPPTVGMFGFNTTNTYIYFNKTGLNSANYTNILQTFVANTRLHIVDPNSPGNVYKYLLITDNITVESTYCYAPVNVLASAGSFNTLNTYNIFWNFPGPKGDKGDSGFAFPYVYHTTFSSPSKHRFVRIDSSSSEIHINRIDLDDVNISSVLTNITPSSQILIYKKSNPAVKAFLNVTGSIQLSSDHITIPVSGSTAGFSAGEEIYFSYTLAGIPGQNGEPGPQGPQGQKGIDGMNGFSFSYTYNTVSSVTSSTGNVSYISSNTTNPDFITEIYLTKRSYYQLNLGQFLDDITNGSYIQLRIDRQYYDINNIVLTNPKISLFRIESKVEYTHYYKFNVVFLSKGWEEGYQNFTYDNNERIEVSFSIRGIQGPPGTAGGAGNYLKEAVHVVTNNNINLSSPPNSIDGFSLSEGSRVLLTGQTNASENGLYVYSSGSLNRSLDADESSELSRGVIVPVTNGNNGANTLWLLKNSADPIDSTNLVFDQIIGNSNSSGSQGSTQKTYLIKNSNSQTYSFGLNNSYTVFRCENNSNYIYLFDSNIYITLPFENISLGDTININIITPYTNNFSSFSIGYIPFLGGDELFSIFRYTFNYNINQLTSSFYINNIYHFEKFSNYNLNMTNSTIFPNTSTFNIQFTTYDIRQFSKNISFVCIGLESSKTFSFYNDDSNEYEDFTVYNYPKWLVTANFGYTN